MNKKVVLLGNLIFNNMKIKTVKKIISQYAVSKNGKLYWRDNTPRIWTRGMHAPVVDELYYVLGKTYSRDAIRRIAVYGDYKTTKK